MIRADPWKPVFFTGNRGRCAGVGAGETINVRMLNPAALALAARMRVRREERYSLIKDFTLSLALMAKPRPVTDMVASFFFS